MKRRQIVTVLGLAAALAVALAAYTAASKTPLPPGLQALGVKISSVSSRRIVYEAENSDQTAVREVTTYTAQGGAQYDYDADGSLLCYTAPAADPDAFPSPAFTADQITDAFVGDLLGGLVPDIGMFTRSDPTNDAGYGYELVMKKNADTLYEDILILRLTYAGELISLNVNRSGLDSSDQIDVSYFDAQLSDLLRDHGDTVTAQSVKYQKIGGVVCAFYTVVFADADGQSYVQLHTLI